MPIKMPIPFPVPAGVTKGRKFRTTWVSYDALAAVHRYLELDRAVTADGSSWRPPPRWGEPLLVTDPDERGGRVNGSVASNTTATQVRALAKINTPVTRTRRHSPAHGGTIARMSV